jgi:hypothetical protein
MTGPALLAKYLETKKMTARDLCRASNGFLNEPEISRYLSGATRPGIDKALAIERVTRKAVPIGSWAKDSSLDPRRVV